MKYTDKLLDSLLCKTMILKMKKMLSSTPYSIEIIKDDARYFVEYGLISRQDRIYILSQFIPDREWVNVERELEKHNFLLRDKIGDLIGDEKWQND